MTTRSYLLSFVINSNDGSHLTTDGTRFRGKFHFTNLSYDNERLETTQSLTRQKERLVRSRETWEHSQHAVCYHQFNLFDSRLM